MNNILIKISSRDVLADLPPSVLKKRIQEIDKREDERNEKFYPFTDVHSIYTWLKKWMLPDVKEWKVNYQGDERQQVEKIKTISIQGEFLTIIAESGHLRLNFNRTDKDKYCFNINSKVKILNIIICGSKKI